MNKEKQIYVGDTLEGQLSTNVSGSAYLTSADLPKDIYIHNTKTNKGLHLDTVKVEVIEGKGRAIEGRVVEVIKRFKTEFVGTLQVTDRFAFLVPDSKKMPTDIFIPLSKLMGGTNGQKAVGKLKRWKDDAKSPNGEIIEILGDAGDNDVEIHSILHEYDLPYRFDEDVIAESEAISTEITDKEIAKRIDMRDILTFTIDPDTAKDFDDALSVDWVDGKMKVGVHIADVSHYLRPDTELDKEALARGTSVYLVDRVVPMLPERLSNGLCSLRPNEDKLCFSAVFTLDNNGKVLEEWFGRTVINSDHRFTYEEAQSVIENGRSIVLNKHGIFDDSVANKMRMWLIDATLDLDKTAKKMRAQRFKKGSISFDKQEVKFDLDENGKPIGIKFKIQKDANKLIEEYMLLANRHVAKFLKKKGVCINRAHDEPNPIKLESLKEFIRPLGYDIKTNSPEEITTTLNKLLMDVKGTSEENMVGNLVIRTMQKAVYTTDNIGHYGLGFQDYTHFTSPIRRYPDVLIHRMLGRTLDGKSPMKVSKLEARCVHCSEREMKAQKASRDSIKYKQCEFMQDKVGLVYHKCIVTSVQDYGLFVEIPETASEGLVRMGEIGGDTYQADTTNHRVVGFNTGAIIRLGDEVSIVVRAVDIEKKNIDLTMIRL